MPSRALFKLEDDTSNSEHQSQPGAGTAQTFGQIMHPSRESRVRLKWDDRIEQLKAFKAKHGHVDVPRLYARDPSLGTFVCNQRQTYKRMNEGKGPSMDRARVQQLNELEFKWVLKHKDQPALVDDEEESDGGLKRSAKGMRPKQLDWESGIKQLMKFKVVNGHLDIPHIYAANQPLGNFVKNIRQNYKNMQKGTKAGKVILTERRIYELKQMGFKLQVRQREPWEQRFQELREFIQKHGNCEVPKHTPLGIWILNQRSQFKLLCKKKPSHMSEERINLLNSIGFDWRISMKHRVQASGMYMYSGRVYAPPGAAAVAASNYGSLAAYTAAITSCDSLPNELPSELPCELPSDEALASVIASEKPAAACYSRDEVVTDLENSAYASSLETSTGMPPSDHQAAALTGTNEGHVAVGNLKQEMQPTQIFASKPAPTARSVIEGSTAYVGSKPSAADSVSLGMNQTYMLPELNVQPSVASDVITMPLPIPAFPVPFHMGDNAAMMSDFNTIQQTEHFATAPAPYRPHRFTADMFVESLLNSDTSMDMGIPFVTEESGSSSDDDQVLELHI